MWSYKQKLTLIIIRLWIFIVFMFRITVRTFIISSSLIVPTNCTLYRAHCTVLHPVPCGTLYRANCTVHTVPYTLYRAHCTAHTVPYTLYRTHCTVHTVPCTLYRTHCTVRTVPCTLYCTNCTVHTVQCTLFRAVWTVHTVPYTVLNTVLLVIRDHFRMTGNMTFVTRSLSPNEVGGVCELPTNAVRAPHEPAPTQLILS